jgi:tRNA-dihydrouridine synthase A
LKGLSPAQNRSVPPLQYGRAYRLRERFPDLCFIINGGIETNEQVREHLTRQDGVMVGRAAYHNPLRLADMHALIFGGEPADSHALLSGYRAHIERELAEGTRLADMTRHALGLFAGSPGARRWRRLMSDAARLRANDIGLIDEALEMIEPMAA